MKTLPVHELFHSWQGEGVHLGRAAYFIRLFGCPVHCPWCDSAGTWHPEHIPAKVPRMSPGELAELAITAHPDFVVITGGEPAIHNLTTLTGIFQQHELPVHIETSGAFPIQGHFDWITLSPKRWHMPLPENLKIADELKIIVDTEEALGFWLKALEGIFSTQHVWLHPEWSQRNNPHILDQITHTVKERGSPFRAGWQMHKLYGVE